VLCTIELAEEQITKPRTARKQEKWDFENQLNKKCSDFMFGAFFCSGISALVTEIDEFV